MRFGLKYGETTLENSLILIWNWRWLDFYPLLEFLMSLRYEYSNYSKLAFDVNIFQAKMQCIDLSFSNVKTSEPIYKAVELSGWNEEFYYL